MFLPAKFVQLVAIFAIFGISHQKVTSVSNENLKCGITFYNGTKSGHHRVNQGDTAAEGQWPWMATFVYRGKQDGFCSAAIISEEYILSAAHCYKYGMNESVQVAVGAVDVVAGHPNLVDIAAAFKHPKYEHNDKSLKNDVLVLKLAKPLVLSNNVQPICLAGKFDGDDVTKPEDESAIVAGWGYKDHDHTPTDTLLYGHMYFVDIDTCAKNHTQGEISKNMHICAAGKVQNTEEGDSGGPIFIKSELKDSETGRNRYVEVGICSFDWNPDVFARVSPYCEFIKETTNGSVNCVDL